jgi:hypothetical protein
MGRIVDFLLRNRNQVLCVVTPLVLLPLPLLVTDQVSALWLQQIAHN